MAQLVTIRKQGDSSVTTRSAIDSHWLTVKEAAQRARCGTRSIYLAVQQGKLQAARLGGRRELRFLASWVDEWLTASSSPVTVN